MEGETTHHLELKDSLYHMFKGMSWVQQCELEYPIAAINRRADIWIATDQARIAIECQVSPISVQELQTKLYAYTQHGIYTTYVLHDKSLPEPDEYDEAIIPVWIRELHALKNPLYIGSPMDVHGTKLIWSLDLADVVRDNDYIGYSYTLKTKKKVHYQVNPISNMTYQIIPSQGKYLNGPFRMAYFVG